MATVPPLNTDADRNTYLKDFKNLESFIKYKQGLSIGVQRAEKAAKISGIAVTFIIGAISTIQAALNDDEENLQIKFIGNIINASAGLLSAGITLYYNSSKESRQGAIQKLEDVTQYATDNAETLWPPAPAPGIA